ncbi:unnamed protein product, partial [Symbiodinium sp. KB8]
MMKALGCPGLEIAPVDFFSGFIDCAAAYTMGVLGTSGTVSLEEQAFGTAAYPLTEAGKL